MSKIRIIHISDLHLSELWFEDATNPLYAPEREGHDIEAFLALDNFLKSHPWHLLLISGDVSRTGLGSSFLFLRNWLEGEIVHGSIRVGLNLSKVSDKYYAVVPGNHDRYDGKLTQGTLDHYHEEFKDIKPGDVWPFNIDKLQVLVHPFNSTSPHGGFGHGEIESHYLVCDDLEPQAINIAMLHHHFIQPPIHKRTTKIELLNNSQVAAYMFARGFDAVVFGHTHKSYFVNVPNEMALKLFPDKRVRRKIFRRRLPMWFIDRMAGPNSVSYKRVKAKNGKSPSLLGHLKWLYLKECLKLKSVKSPSEFDTPKEFHEHVNSINVPGLAELVDEAKSKHTLISMANTACKAKAEVNEFHEIIVDVDEENGGRKQFSCKRYRYESTKFKEIAVNIWE